jgi:hypothetical protein
MVMFFPWKAAKNGWRREEKLPRFEQTVNVTENIRKLKSPPREPNEAIPCYAF